MTLEDVVGDGDNSGIGDSDTSQGEVSHVQHCAPGDEVFSSTTVRVLRQEPEHVYLCLFSRKTLLLFVDRDSKKSDVQSFYFSLQTAGLN